MSNIQSEQVTANNEKIGHDFDKEQEGQMTRFGRRKGRSDVNFIIKSKK